MRLKTGWLAGFFLISFAACCGSAIAQEESASGSATEDTNIVPKEDTDRGYTNKSYHDGEHVYKHPGNSYTSPMDYGERRVAVEPAEPKGRCNCFTFDGTKSHTPNRQKLTYSWDFGDGETSDQPVVKHCFQKAGDYAVKLTVRDESGRICGEGMDETKVYANFPPTADAGEDQEACVGEEVSFRSSSSSVSRDGIFIWYFGYGIMSEVEWVSHAYQKPGTYKVHLEVNDGRNTECSMAQDAASVSVTPRAEVSLAGVESVCVGQTARFQATGSSISKYSWDFGDGTTWEGGAGASHSYAKGGSYTVRVTADTGKGGKCAVAATSTNVKVNASPLADAGENLACCVGANTTFDGSGSSSPAGNSLSYHWDFGDGESAEGVRVTHAYAKPGNYRVVLTVKDDSGSACGQASDSFVANVSGKPEAVIQVR